MPYKPQAILKYFEGKRKIEYFFMPCRLYCFIFSSLMHNISFHKTYSVILFYFLLLKIRFLSIFNIKLYCRQEVTLIDTNFPYQIWTFCSTCFSLHDTANYLRKTHSGDGLRIFSTCSYSVPLFSLGLFLLEGWYHIFPRLLPKFFSLATHWLSWWLVTQYSIYHSPYLTLDACSGNAIYCHIVVRVLFLILGWKCLVGFFILFYVIFTLQVYVWSKHNPFIHMSFLGLFTFTATYLPWVSFLADSSVAYYSKWLSVTIERLIAAYYWILSLLMCKLFIVWRPKISLFFISLLFL